MPQKKNRQTRIRNKEQEDTILLEVSRQGPLPHPAVLEEYNRLAPGAVDRILHLAEEDSRHRMSMEMAALNSRIEQREWQAMERRIGQFLGLLLGLASVGAGTWLAATGHEAPGAIIAAAGLAFLVLASWLRGTGGTRDD